MAIRKNNSRNTDRVKIKKMFAQGYTILQIEQKLSITPEHITYVLEQYEKDLGKHKKAQSELNTFREAEKQALAADQFKPVNSGVNLAAITANIEARIRAELAAGVNAVADALPEAKQTIVPDPVIPDPVIDEIPDGEAEVKDEEKVEKTAEAEKKPKIRRRRRAA